MIGCLPTQALALLAVFVYATHATQAIAFEWKPGLRLELYNTLIAMFNAGLSRVVFAAYNNLDRWMQPPETNQSSGQPLANTGSQYRVRSKIISASINEPSGSAKKLIEPVEFVLQHSNVSTLKATCNITEDIAVDKVQYTCTAELEGTHGLN